MIPYLFENFLILSLDSKWISAFGVMPSFRVFVDKAGRLNIVSEETCLRQ
jgi:hypothetical protein